MKSQLARARVFAVCMVATALACLSASQIVLAQQATGAGQSVDTPLPFDSAVTIGVLPNGMRYYIRENHKPEKRAELRLVVNAGSVLEDEDQRGLAHMVEHMAFRGTKKFAGNEISSYLESVGMRFGPDINAFTSFDETVYMVTIPTDTAAIVDKGFQILSEWAHNVAFEPSQIEKERPVVIEEWRLGQGPRTECRTSGSRCCSRAPGMARVCRSVTGRFWRLTSRPRYGGSTRPGIVRI